MYECQLGFDGPSLRDGRKLKHIYSRFKLEVGFLQCFLDERNKIG